MEPIFISFLFFVCIDLLILLAFGLVMGIEKYNEWRSK